MRIPDSIRYARYSPGGREPSSGLDCWGLYRELRRANGMAVPPPHPVPDGVSCADVVMGERDGGDWLPVRSPRTGDLAVWTRTGGRVHCGFVVDGRTVIHMGLHGMSLSRTDRMSAYGELETYRYIGEDHR